MTEATRGCCGPALLDAIHSSQAAAGAVDATMRRMQFVVAREDWPTVRIALEILEADQLARGHTAKAQWTRAAIDKHNEEFAKTPHGRREAIRQARGLGRGPAPADVANVLAALEAECAATHRVPLCQRVGTGIIGSTERTVKRGVDSRPSAEEIAADRLAWAEHERTRPPAAWQKSPTSEE